MLIISKPVINKSKKGVDLLVKHLLLPPKKPLRLQKNETKPRGWPCKNTLKKLNKRVNTNNIAIEEDVKDNNVVEIDIVYTTKWIKTQPCFDPKSKIDLGGIIDKNPPVRDGLIRPVYKVTKSVTKTSSKM